MFVRLVKASPVPLLAPYGFFKKAYDCAKSCGPSFAD
jgi:hypothetical protein